MFACCFDGRLKTRLNSSSRLHRVGSASGERELILKTESARADSAPGKIRAFLSTISNTQTPFARHDSLQPSDLMVSEPVNRKVVVQVAYHHFTGGRFRQGTRFLRWRPEKAPRQCTSDQVEQREGKAIALLRR